MPTLDVVSTKYDGYEDIYTLDKLENLTAKDIEDVENNYKKLDIENTFIKESEVIAKSNTKWLFLYSYTYWKWYFWR